MSISLTVL
uniref:Uncharacterized protein n=1 Tax=Nymphaea colorata TaxID=210225 RepID=A0A5K1EN89_9MAGN